MLEHQEYLSLVAELAVALAGFTGIVAVFRFRRGDWEGESITKFQTMLRASISAMFLALLPYLLFMFLDDRELTWRFGNLVVATIMGLNIWYFLSRGGLFRASLVHRAMLPLGASICFGNFLGALLILPSAKMYVLAISFQLLVSVYNFSLLIMSDTAEQGLGIEQSSESN